MAIWSRQILSADAETFGIHGKRPKTTIFTEYVSLKLAKALGFTWQKLPEKRSPFATLVREYFLSLDQLQLYFTWDRKRLAVENVAIGMAHNIWIYRLFNRYCKHS